jgi:hypothetical protein
MSDNTQRRTDDVAVDFNVLRLRTTLIRISVTEDSAMAKLHMK